MTFADMGVDQDMVAALAAKGIEEPFPIQAQTIPLALTGQDIIGQAKTGTGKTLGFGLPLIQRLGTDPEPGVQALVVVPTRELCVQVAEDLVTASSGRSTAVVAIYGGKAYEGQIEQINAGAQIVVGTPGRLLDLAGQRVLSLSRVREMVLDEADKMLDLGFLPDIEKLFAQVPAERHTMLFSATMPGPIVALARRFMSRPIHIRASAPDESIAQANIKHLVYRTHSLDKDEVIARILQSEGRGKTVIFMRTKRAAAKLLEELKDRGFNAGAVHGDLSQEQRERAMAAFKAGKKDILIATDVAARGIDVTDVTHVINHTVPDDEKSYLHRVGRTGRAGKTGIAVTFVDWDELHKWALINRALEFGQPEPVETYSSSPHLYAELGIPEGVTGRLRSAGSRPATRHDDGPRRRHDGDHDRSSHHDRRDAGSEAAGEHTAGGARKRRRRRSRNGAAAGAGSQGAAAPAGAQESRGPAAGTAHQESADASGTHDGQGAGHHDGNSAPRRRSRNRRRAGGGSTTVVG